MHNTTKQQVTRQFGPKTKNTLLKKYTWNCNVYFAYKNKILNKQKIELT